jgi:hypothetical protein
MSAESKARESFIRWQSITLGHFSAVSNLTLGLSTGLLAFFSNALLAPQSVSGCALALSTLSLGMLALSVAVAVCCAINRLRDFRATAQIARARSKGQPVAEESRREVKVLGKLSWRLFWWQLVLFAIGAGSAALSVVLRLWH